MPLSSACKSLFSLSTSWCRSLSSENALRAHREWTTGSETSCPCWSPCHPCIPVPQLVLPRQTVTTSTIPTWMYSMCEIICCLNYYHISKYMYVYLGFYIEESAYSYTRSHAWSSASWAPGIPILLFGLWSCPFCIHLVTMIETKSIAQTPAIKPRIQLILLQQSTGRKWGLHPQIVGVPKFLELSAIWPTLYHGRKSATRVYSSCSYKGKPQQSGLLFNLPY